MLLNASPLDARHQVPRITVIEKRVEGRYRRVGGVNRQPSAALLLKARHAVLFSIGCCQVLSVACRNPIVALMELGHEAAVSALRHFLKAAGNCVRPKYRDAVPGFFLGRLIGLCGYRCDRAIAAVVDVRHRRPR